MNYFSLSFLSDSHQNLQLLVGRCDIKKTPCLYKKKIIYYCDSLSLSNKQDNIEYILFLGFSHYCTIATELTNYLRCVFKMS